jgi:hypothetical protein
LCHACLATPLYIGDTSESIAHFIETWRAPENIDEIITPAEYHNLSTNKYKEVFQ